MRLLRVAVVTVALCGMVGTSAAQASSGTARAPAGSLSFAGELGMRGQPGVCPAGTPSNLGCYPRSGEGVIPGLGKVTQSWVLVLDGAAPGCPDGTFVSQKTTVRLTVLGKGEILLALGGLSSCLDTDDVVNHSAPFAVAGGSGVFTGVSGSGTVTHEGTYVFSGSKGTDTYTGTIVVDGHEFDLTPPVLAGVANRAEAAPKGATRTRVRFAVTAQDQVDGRLAVTCTPKPRSLFRLGRTKVGCSASDTSGNTASTTFSVTVKARR